MLHMSPTETGPSIKPFKFESYGVKVQITSNDQEMINLGEAVARRSLLGNLRRIGGRSFDCVFQLNRTKSGRMQLLHNGEHLAGGRGRKKFLKFFDSVIRATIGEYSTEMVFLHAGVVGWKGRAIIMPADSFKGKTTLVSELVRHGATYYSDDFAVVDRKGLVHPFARPLSMRTEDFRPYELSVDDLGGIQGKVPIPPSMVLFTEYLPNKRWAPKRIPAGQSILEMIPFTLSLRKRPELSMHVLRIIAERTLIMRSPRGRADKLAKILLEFVDKLEY